MATTNAARLIALFGGCIATAAALGEDKATISRLTSTGKRGTHGKIPPRMNQAIMKAAKTRGFPAQAYALLDLTCPTCGGKWKP